MKHSVQQELAKHILDNINDGVITNDNIDDWHFHCFNESMYLVYYSECDKWLDEHGFGQFEAAGICQQYETDNFGESNSLYDNSEKVVNMLAYIFGEELLSNIDADTIDELQQGLEEIVA